MLSEGLILHNMFRASWINLLNLYNVEPFAMKSIAIPMFVQVVASNKCKTLRQISELLY